MKYTTCFLMAISFLASNGHANEAQKAFYRGNAKLESEDYQAAIKEFTNAVELDPTYEKAYFQSIKEIEKEE